MYTIDFIGNHINGFTKGMQELTDFGISANHTSTGINHKYDDIRFVNSSMRLLRHIIIDVAATIISFTNTARIDDNKGFAFIYRIAVLTVTSQP